MPLKDKRYDAFISYAVEDRIGIVNDLVQHLRELGINLWYANTELRVGVDIHKSISEGLANTGCAIVILSRNYFERQWPKKELNALILSERHLVIPVWYDVKMQEVREYDPTLVELWGIECGQDIFATAQRIAEVIKKKQKKDQQSKAIANRPWWLLAFVMGFVLAAFAVNHFIFPDVPDENFILQTIENRVEEYNQDIINDYMKQNKKLRLCKPECLHWEPPGEEGTTK